MKHIIKISLLLALTLVIIGCSKDNSEPIIETPEPTPTQIITVSTIAGNGDIGSNNGSANIATFSLPTGIVRDAYGNIYVADTDSHRIRKIDLNGTVSTFSGSDKGFADGSLTEAKFNKPTGLVIDSNGNIYVTDKDNNRIRIITLDGKVNTLAGASRGDKDGLGADANFNSPTGIDVDVDGNLIVSDNGNHKIKMVTPFGMVTTIAGSDEGFADGIGNEAQFNFPFNLAVNKDGNIYVTDAKNHRIRKVTPEGNVTTLTGSREGLNNGVLSEALFSHPLSIASDDLGNLYVAGSNYQIRKISSEGVVSTIAGSTSGYDDGLGIVAKFERIHDICIDESNNLLMADSENYRIRKITIEESN
ncbi:hypothetical protein FVB32_11510 [Flagellimonas hymeniacidonis]|uniref:NHL repeat-containing protein n=1 Tax=Flagellimonas hymeniacidonis TaxID=2603628 RepID=A0A5C8V239_9FLAO|nr:NHL repeat-containing protein [Flagellimonas hymeniacidonis]TXN35209.1 hypothetical protein FVB32_11510 [Flagellimonas hymeniacidonis]